MVNWFNIKFSYLFDKFDTIFCMRYTFGINFTTVDFFVEVKIQLSEIVSANTVRQCWTSAIIFENENMALIQIARVQINKSCTENNKSFSSFLLFSLVTF
jgi:hypothetical protein